MKKYIAAGFLGVLFMALTILVKIYDVAAIGPAGTEIGFSHINQKVHDMTGVNMRWYEITDLFGYAAIGICLIFAFAGFVQLIKRKSLFRVDRDILALGGLFAADIALYALFEKVIINYRPVIMPGETAPEASFPSSHTILIITVMIAVMLIIDDYVKSWGLSTIIKIACVIAAVVTVGGRLYSGVHWFTDIIAGILLSVTLLFIFSGIIERGNNRIESIGGRPVLSKHDKVIRGYKCKH